MSLVGRYSVHVFVDILPSNDGHLPTIRKATRFLSWRKRAGGRVAFALLLMPQLVRLLGALHQ